MLKVWNVFITYHDIFLRGLLGTLIYAAIAVSLGTIIGTFIAFMHLSKNKLISSLAGMYVNVLRGTPLLVQMYLSYFFLPMVIPALNNIDKVYFVMCALTLNSSAYVAEIIRSGINSVDVGQTEAARSLGLSHRHTMEKIILPQAIRNILPALGNEYIAMIKETSLAGTFMLYELMYTQTVLANKFLVWEPLFVIAALYLIVTLVLSYGVKKLEAKLHV